MLVTNRHKLVAVPALMFVVKAEDVAEFVRGHPFRLPPPKRGDVDIHASALAETIVAGVIAGVGLAGEVNVFNLVRAWDEADLRAGIHPPLDGAFNQGLLGFAKL